MIVLKNHQIGSRGCNNEDRFQPTNLYDFSEYYNYGKG
jgi:hypothetical protein